MKRELFTPGACNSGNNTYTMITMKGGRSRAIAVLSVLVVLSVLFLWEEDLSEYSEFQRQLLQSDSSSLFGMQRSHCRDGSPAKFRKHTSAELKYLRQSHECARSIRKMKNPWSPVFEDVNLMPMSECSSHNHTAEESMGNNPMEHVMSAIKKYRKVYFVGDSIMGQQFTLMKCMLDPNLGDANHFFDFVVMFDHVANTLSKVKKKSQDSAFNSDTKGGSAAATVLEWVPWGFRTTPPNFTEETVLYQKALPVILANATSNDAIIIGGGAHYNHKRMGLLKDALEFVGEMSRMTDGDVYIMEPTPEEWMTRNGMYGKTNKGCVKLSKDAILGQEMLYPKEHVSCSPEDENCNDQFTSVMEQLYHQDKIPSKLSLTVPPATWRSDLAQSIFLNDDKVNFVPTYHHLLQSNTKSNRNERDCTHKSLSATYFMNLQLLGSIIVDESKSATELD